ncbi:MAG: F0F1 ATP synthase subunit B [Peptoniphilus sp.]|nr:F0F1 ATP synthase subunit B [Peptoniphilus sp.]MDD7363219.1 F0F1 ATP synthase subunit B [Bacillota bacterium]MDY6044457.1 F0F1 ATP synthase subunit B [Peptoniphilus sp.]
MEIFVVPDIWNLLAQWGATLILFLVIRHFVYEPVNNFLTKRQETIASDLEEAKSSRLEAENLKTDYEKKLGEAKEEGAKIIEKSRERGRQLEKVAADDAKSRADSMLEKAKADIEREKAKARREVQDETSDLAVLIAEKLLKDNIDAEHQEELVDGLIDDLENNHV